MLQAPVNEHNVVVKFVLMQNSDKNESELVNPSLEAFKKITFHIRYVHANGNDGVTSNSYIFSLQYKRVLQYGRFHMDNFHVFKFELKLI
jgi:hypothetical protein